MRTARPPETRPQDSAPKQILRRHRRFCVLVADPFHTLGSTGGIDVLNLRLATGKRQPDLLVVLLTAAPVVALGGCATATTSTGAGPNSNAYLIVMAGFAVIFVVTMKATALMTAALADLMVILRRMIATLAMFVSAAVLTGAGMAIVAWVTLD